MISIVANWAKSELVAALRFVISFGLDVCTSTSAILLSGLFPNCVNAMISIFMLFASSANATTSALLPEFETSQSTFFFSLLTSCGSKTWISFSKMIGLPTRDHFCRISSTTKEEAPTPYKKTVSADSKHSTTFWIVSSSRISTVSFIATCALLPSLFLIE